MHDPVPGALVVVTTLPDEAAGERLASLLVEKRLAACVNISAPLTSIYRWQGKIEREREVMLTIKTTAKRYRAIEETIKNSHPYELPEVIALPITDGSTDYLAWIETCTKD